MAGEEVTNDGYGFASRIDNIKEAAIGNKVLSGCAVTEQSPLAMAVDVADGTLVINGNAVFVSSTSKNITAADPTNDRWDLICVGEDGTVDYVAGTAAANPYPPDLPADHIALAEILVQNGVETIGSSDIKDRRLIKLVSIEELNALVTAGQTAIKVLDLTRVETANVHCEEDWKKLIADVFSDNTGYKDLTLYTNDNTTAVWNSTDYRFQGGVKGPFTSASVSYYHCDDGSGTTVTDENGTNNGTASSASIWNASSRFGSYCLYCNNTYDVNFGDVFTLSNGTFDCWIKLDTVGVDQYIFAKNAAGDNTGDCGLTVINTNKLQFWIFDTTLRKAESTKTLGTGRWYHIRATWGSSGMKIYVDGQLWGTNSYTGGIGGNSADFIVGSSTGTLYLRGRIDEIRISNTQITTFDYLASSVIYGKESSLVSLSADVTHTMLVYEADLSDSGTSITYDISADGGVNWDTDLAANALNAITNTGQDLRIKINLKTTTDSSLAKIYGWALYYWTE